ncbi:hypothetical protein [Nostoc sp.]|uniref:hypothetical protein n=1 Tax=Nostoc sp. TaxID=1180 RepID=UPI002FF97730
MRKTQAGGDAVTLWCSNLIRLRNGFETPKFQRFHIGTVLSLAMPAAANYGILKAADQVQGRNFRNHCSFHPL